MKVLLIFPPLWIPYRPYLSVPSLCGYLKSKGIDVIQKDFNVEAYDLLLSEGYLKGITEKLKNKFNELNSKSRLMPGVEQEYYCDLYKAKSSIEYVAGRIEHAKGIFRSKQAFYDVNALSNARETLKLAQAIISTGCFPTGQDLIWPINARLQRSLEDIKKLTQNRAENLFLELYEQHLLPFIIEQDPDIIGISITVDSQFIPSLTLGRLIKSSYKKAHVVVGGGVITLMSDMLMKHQELFNLFFDSAVLHEGERPLLKLVENIASGRPLDDVPNLIYLDNGKVRVNDVLPSEDINSLPTPDFDGLPLDLYLNPEPVLPLLSSRGCYWGRCAFCSDNICYRWPYQNRDASKVVYDMQELSRKYRAVHFAFSDEAISPGSLSKLSDELINRGLNVRCSADVRLERQFTPDLCKKAFKAGFKLLYSGLESGCNRVLDRMEKGITRETAAEVCRNIHEAGIWNHLYIFFGFPTETWAEAQETINFLVSNESIIHSFNIDKFILPKMAPMTRQPELYGISSIDKGRDTDFNLSYNYTVSSGLTNSEADELSHVYAERIAIQYRCKKFFKLNLESLLVYLSHFENNDPYLLRPVPPVNSTNIQSNQPPTLKSVPRIKRNVVIDKLRFNIVDIMNNTSGNNGPVYPSETCIIVDPVSGNLQSIHPQIMEVFTLYDGRKSVQQIARELSSKYYVTQDKTEKDCISLLQSLSREGYVSY
jgi:anaerobic magnesium-protoporphyrin IX monomethyl ester cyclase